MSQVVQLRRVVWTGAIAAVAVTGALYGASLKTQQESNAATKKSLEATPAEKIAQLEAQRASLVTKRTELERKIALLDARQKGVVPADAKAGKGRDWNS